MFLTDLKLHPHPSSTPVYSSLLSPLQVSVTNRSYTASSFSPCLFSLWYTNCNFLSQHFSCTSYCFPQMFLKGFYIFSSNFIVFSWFLSSLVCIQQEVSLLPLHCAPHAFLSFIPGLNSSLDDKDPPLGTDKRSHYPEGRQRQLRLALFLSHMNTNLHWHMQVKTHEKMCTTHYVYQML